MQTNRDRAVNSALTVWTECSSLTHALHEYWGWQKDSMRHGLGSVHLSFNRGQWIVLVSQDLMDAELPF